MVGFHLQLGLKSLKRNPALTTLMAAAIGLGSGICFATLNVYYFVSGNPIPERSDVLYAVQMDSWDPVQPWDEDRPEVAPFQLTYRDARAVLESDIPNRKVVMHKSAFVLSVAEGQSEVRPYNVVARLTTKDFFPMFDTPFLFGNGWDAASDDGAAAVIVLSRKTNDKVFGGEDSVGRTLRLTGTDYRVVGVLDAWKPVPKFYDVNNGAFEDIEDVYMPFGRSELLEARSAGNVNCWKPEVRDTYRSFLDSECAWIQVWVELAAADRVEKFKAWLDSHVAEQKRMGRFPRPLNNRLSRPDEWLELNEVVATDNRVLLGISFMFLVACVVNIVGLLLAKFSLAAPVVSLHRALGATRSMVFRQHVTEVGILGIAGGILGIAFGALALLGIRQLYDNYDELTRVNWTIGLAAIGISLVAALAAGVYPAWRIMQLEPAAHLKIS